MELYGHVWYANHVQLQQVENLLPELLARCSPVLMQRSDGMRQVVHGRGTLRPVGGAIGVMPAPQCALIRVPLVIARRPRQSREERVEEVVERPGDDDVVVHAHDGRNDDHSVSNT